MAPDTPPVHRLTAFTAGEWLVDPRACHMSRAGTTVKLRPQLVDLLVCLARRHGEIVLKDEIFAEVWPGQFIADSGLSRCVAELRQLLQDDVQEPRYIETIPKRGYRLIAPVTWMSPPAPDAPATPAAQAVPATAGQAGAGPPKGRRRRASAAAAAVLLAAAIVAALVLTRTPAKVLTEQDNVLLAFENHTGDAVFDETVPLAMAIQLEQSPYLRLLSPGRTQETLRMMQRPPDTAITRAVGMEICERVGARALIVTSLASLGRQYAVGLEALACGTGRVLARRQVATDRKERVLRALQDAAVEIRRAVGEPAASLERYNVPIVEATTPSLDALRALRRGDLARNRGQVDVALGFYREAVALDGDFALAYARQAMADWGVGRVAALQKAYALRERVTLPERLEIEVAYHQHVTGDSSRVFEALGLLIRSYPRRASAHRDLAREYLDASGQYDAGLGEALEALRLEPDSAPTTAIAARAYVYGNRVAEAARLAERGLALSPASPELHFALFLCGVVGDDPALAARERAWAVQHPEVPDFPDFEAEEAIKDGRLGEALGFLAREEAWASARSAEAPHEIGRFSDIAARIRLRAARYEALAGFPARAMRRVEAELARRPGPMAKLDAATVAITAGRFDAAERLLEEVDREGQFGQWGQTLARVNRALVVASRGRTREALDVLEPLRPYELGYRHGLEPLFARGWVHYQGGDWEDAKAAFETFLAHTTIDTGRKLLPHVQLALARTLARAGDEAAARGAYERFFDGWKNADPGLPVLLEARREHAALRAR